MYKEHPVVISTFISMIVVIFFLIAFIHQGNRITNYLEKAAPAGKERTYIICKEVDKLRKDLIKSKENSYDQDLILLKNHDIIATPIEIEAAKKQYKYELKHLKPVNCKKINEIGPNPKTLN